jgi:casein kinase II subunit beta
MNSYDIMKHEKYQNADFGRCPRVNCQRQNVLPVGLSDIPQNFSVNVFCPKCHGLYYPRSTKQANLDGAYFGTTFSHLFLLLHPELIPPKPTITYAPRIYGFRVHKDSVFYQQR